MAYITDITNDWSAGVTLTTNEDWQCQGSAVWIRTGASAPTGEGGIQLKPGDVMQIASGEKVYYSAADSRDAKIWREPRP